MTLFAGIDLGTRAVRCLVVDEAGRRVAGGSRPWRALRTTDPEAPQSEPGMVDVDPTALLDALATAVREALAGCESGAIAAVGVASQRSGVAFVDDDGAALYVGSNTDARALVQGIEQQRLHGDLIYRVAGRLPAMLYMPARLAWFRVNRPEEAARIRWALPLSDWLVHALTGVAATEPTQAAELLVRDVAAGRWSDALLAALEVPEAILPMVRAPGEPAGAMTTGAAERFGLPEGVPVVAAGGDTQAALLGAGVLEPGHAAVVAGTTMLASVVTDTSTVDAAGRFWCSPHAAPGLFVHEAHCGEAGAPLDWLAAMMGLDVAAMAAEAERGQPGAGGVAFVDAGPSSVSDFPLMRRGGLTFPAPLLALARPRADVARAAFEGTAFGARAGLDWLAEAHGEPPSIALTGGVSRSGVFRAALAGTSKAPVRVSCPGDASALGAAIVAAAAHHGGVREAARAMADAGEPVEARAAEGYEAHYDAWRAHARALGEGTVRLKDMW